MGDFDLVEAGFNNADETLNFGTRSIGCVTSLFETCTIACFKSEDEDFSGVSEIVINSVIKNRYLFFATDESLKVFRDMDMTQLFFNGRFESTITHIAVSPDEHFFIVCLENGLICLFHINDMDVLRIYSECLNKNVCPQSTYVIDDIEDDELKASFMVVFQNGLISRINVKKANDDDGDGQFEIHVEEIFNLNCKIVTSDYFSPLLITNGSKINIFHLEAKHDIFCNSLNLKKLMMLEGTFLCLDFDGNLLKLCPHTLTILFVHYDFLIDDFLIIKDDKPQILFVTKPNEIGEVFLQLLESDLTQIFSLKINYPIRLVEMYSTKSDILFISKITNDEKVIELRLQIVSETEHELRLTRLIKRRRFEEAEKFAKAFNMDPRIILKAKAQLIVDKTKSTSEDIKLLLGLMDSINDAQFNLQCCINVDCSNFDDLRKILTYGSKISPKIEDQRGEYIMHMKGNMLDLLFRFNTFMALSKRGDNQSWSNFSMCNLLLEVKEYLKNYRIQDAIIIYSRLDKKTINSLNEQHIEDILEIFNNLPTDLYQPFLPTFIPVTMTHVPSALHLFVKWLLDKIYHLEKRDAANFLENSIKMVEEIVKLIKVEKKNYISFQRHCMSNRDFEDLANIVKGLNVLETLKKQFGITVQLNEYLEGARALTSTLVKLSMVPERYDYFLENFLYTYMLQNGIDPDTIFIEEIMILLEYSESWIAIIEVILKYISSVETKLKTVKVLLEKAPLPWCEITRRITKTVLQVSHPLVKDIYEVFEDERRLIVLRNNKYGIKKKQVDEEFERVIHRIIYINEPKMIDDIYQLCRSDKQHLEASVILIQCLIKEGRLDEAQSVLNTKIPKQVFSCAQRLVNYTELIINQNFNKNIQKNCYAISKPLYNKLIELSTDQSERKQFEDDARILRGVFYFKNKLNCNFTTHDFKSPLTRNEKYKDLLNIVVEKVNEASLTFTEVVEYSEKIAYYLSKDKDEVLINLCEKMKHFEIIYKLGEHFLENDTDIQNLCLVGSLIMKYLGYKDSSVFETSALGNYGDQTLPVFDNLKYEDDSYKNDIFVTSLTIAEQLITKARMKAGPNDILKINAIDNWINSCFFITRPNSTLHDELYKNIYCSKENLPSDIVLSTIRSCYEAYTLTLDVKSVNSEYLKYFSDSIETTQKPVISEISSLSSSIEIFCRGGQYLTAFSLLTILGNSLYLQPSVDKNILKPLQTLIQSKFRPQIVHAVVSAKYIDLELLYNLLLSSRQNAMKCLMYYLQTYKRDSKKLYYLSIVGVRLLDFYQESKGKDALINNVRTCKWWRKLTTVHSKMMYDDFFKSDADIRLKNLIHLEVVGIEEIRQYCEDFKLVIDQYYKEYLLGSLINWKPQYKIKSITGRNTVVVENDEKLLYTKCQNIIDAIGDKEKVGVFSSMEKIVKEVNFYHYEVFHTVYRILANNTQVTNSTNMNMLAFLKSYTRFKGPSRREKEEWYITFPDTQHLDPLSEYRLPFIPIMYVTDIWSILRPEMSLKSYELWFGATNILSNLKVDDICTFAVKDLVSNKLLKTDSTGGWALYSKFDYFFNEVDECVQHISDLSRATSAVYELMNGMPDGADKVKAAKLCFKYASKYRHSNVDDPQVERAFIKVKNKFYGLSACHILHRFNLAKSNYLELVAQPSSLIEHLYMDERIPKYAGMFCLDYSDINNAVEALCDLFNLDMRHIHLELLNQLLSCSNTDVDMDTSYYFVPISSNVPKISNDEDNLKRAIYICSSGNKEDWQSYFLTVGLNENEEDCKNLAFRARALKCFCAITDESIIVELTKLSYNEFLNYIDKLTLLSELESLGIFLNTDSLQEFDKKRLLKKLSTIGKPLAIKCMGAVCITYFLEEDKYWDYIIKSAIKFEMIEELKVYVEFLIDKYDKNYYINAWQVVIDKSFQKVSTASNEKELTELLENNFLMIQSCPVSFSLNFEKMIDICVNVNKAEYAVILLQYMSKEKRICVEQDLLKHESVNAKLEQLEKQGLWRVRRYAD